MNEFWLITFFLSMSILLLIILIYLYQISKESEDFYQAMYREEENGKNKNTTKR